MSFRAKDSISPLGDAPRQDISNQRLSNLLADVLYRAQCACLSFDETGRPHSIQADMHIDRIWFYGLEGYWPVLEDLEQRGFVTIAGHTLSLTEKGIRAKVTSPGFSKEELGERQNFFRKS